MVFGASDVNRAPLREMTARVLGVRYDGNIQSDAVRRRKETFSDVTIERDGVWVL